MRDQQNEPDPADFGITPGRAAELRQWYDEVAEKYPIAAFFAGAKAVVEMTDAGENVDAGIGRKLAEWIGAQEQAA